MTDDEREGWRHSLQRVATRDDAIENILDRVEKLESDLALKADALRIAYAERDEAQRIARIALAELSDAREWAAARAEPPRPVAIVTRYIKNHRKVLCDAFESAAEAEGFWHEIGIGELIRDVTYAWHPAKDSPVAP